MTSMTERAYLTAVPAFYANYGTLCVPFIVSVLVVDAQGKRRLTPAVEASINSTVEITGREGLATAIIADTDVLPATALRYLERASAVAGGILLFLCQRGETAERVMQSISTAYRISLVTRDTSGPRMERNEDWHGKEASHQQSKPTSV